MIEFETKTNQGSSMVSVFLSSVSNVPIPQPEGRNNLDHFSFYCIRKS